MKKFNYDLFNISKPDKVKLSKSIAFYAQNGIEISTESDSKEGRHIISIKQININDGVLLNRKELESRAKAVISPYITKDQYVIHQKVFTPDFPNITIEWIEGRMKKYGISRHDLEKQLSIDKFTLSKIFSTNRGMTRSMKAAIYYYLMVYELNQSRKKETEKIIAQSEEIINKYLKK